MTKMTATEWIYQGVVLGQASGALPPVDPPADPPAVEPPADPAPADHVLDPKDAAADRGEDDAPPTPPADAPPTPPAADWKDRRIAQLTARLRESERKAANVGTQTGDVPPPPAAAADSAELDRLVEARASEKAAIDDFNRRCNETVAVGKEAFPDFDSKISDLKGLVDFSSPIESMNYNQFLIAALETGEAPALLHRLGSNLNEAMRILALSPMKMAVELTKLAAMPPTEVSSAPRPIRPPSGNVGGSREPIDPADAERADRLTTTEWMRRREAQVAARQGNGRARA